MNQVRTDFARIITAPDGAQLLIYLYLSEKGTFLQHCMIVGQIQLEFRIGPYKYADAYYLLNEGLDEQAMIEEILRDPIKTFNELTEDGTIRDSFRTDPGPSLN